MVIFLLYKKTQKQIVFLQQNFADFTRDEKNFSHTLASILKILKQKILLLRPQQQTLLQLAINLPK